MGNAVGAEPVYLPEIVFLKIFKEILQLAATVVGTTIIAFIVDTTIRQNVAAWADANFVPKTDFAFRNALPNAPGTRVIINA